MEDFIRVTGHITIEFSDGRRAEYQNRIVDTGKNLILRLLSGEDVPIESVGVGSGGDPSVDTHTSLQTGIGVAKKLTKVTVGISDIVFESIFGYNEGNGTIREVGVFATDGTMFARKVVAEETKDSTQTMKIRYKVSISGGNFD